MVRPPTYADDLYLLISNPVPGKEVMEKGITYLLLCCFSHERSIYRKAGLLRHLCVVFL
uniref:Uncharacterized protein n=1 Tax=Picea sitchensis TaxID=3332 RepID=A0A6B9XUK2_PICSI|nr:hypothetical protein Q903MT_gene4034 [Picea sitchensis]